MYIDSDEERKQKEIEKLQSILENFNRIKDYGPDFIKDFEKHMEREPENTEMLQHRINSITGILMNYDTIVAPYVNRLAALMS